MCINIDNWPSKKILCVAMHASFLWSSYSSGDRQSGSSICTEKEWKFAFAFLSHPWVATNNTFFIHGTMRINGAFNYRHALHGHFEIVKIQIYSIVPYIFEIHHQRKFVYLVSVLFFFFFVHTHNFNEKYHLNRMKSGNSELFL